MSVRAKFKCISVLERCDGKDRSYDILLQPVCDLNPRSENGQFYRWTPSGEIKLVTLREAAGEAFKAGEEYYIDFTPAAVPAAE